MRYGCFETVSRERIKTGREYSSDPRRDSRMFNGELEVVQPRRRTTVYGPQLGKKIYCL